MMINYEDAPLRPFHLRIATAAMGGVFCDGFGLGIIGIVLSAATLQLSLSPLWIGLLGSSSLAGLFVGALLTGPVADRFGRRPVFAYNMALLGLLSLLQFLIDSHVQLLILRFVIGILLGTDYVVSKAQLAEFSPCRFRGRLLSTLSIAWVSGYVCAYITGYALNNHGPDAWRWMLLSSALPAFAILPLRLTVPESPLWLTDHGFRERAKHVVDNSIGVDIFPPARSEITAGHWLQWQLFSQTWRRNTVVACVFFTCQVIPYFALGTFIPTVMSALNVGGNYSAGLVYNILLLVGAVFGLSIVDRITRRSFLIGSFVITASAMLTLSLWAEPPSTVTILVFGVFAATLSAASNLVYAYLPELFPTELRASGIGLAIATSRIGSAVSTFWLPILVANVGIREVLAGCAGVLALGGWVCMVFAPETKNVQLNELAKLARAKPRS
jgi:putative MFS transporter